MSREEMVGSNEMAFGTWIRRAQGMVSYMWALLGDFMPIETHWDCMLRGVERATPDTCRLLAKDAEAIWRVECSGRKRLTLITDDTASCCFFWK